MPPFSAVPSPPHHEREPVLGRNCDGCTLCCKLLAVAELDKPPDRQCGSCDTEVGCAIYAGRPTECRAFYCEFLLDPALGEEWRPSRSRMVVSFEDYSNALVVHVDGDAPARWQAEPYLSQLQAWAYARSPQQTQVAVWQGEVKVVIAPKGRRTVTSEVAS